jgi:hypothetical protein
VTQSPVERYLRLGLRVGRHVEGIIDARYQVVGLRMYAGVLAGESGSTLNCSIPTRVMH